MYVVCVYIFEAATNIIVFDNYNTSHSPNLTCIIDIIYTTAHKFDRSV